MSHCAFWLPNKLATSISNNSKGLRISALSLFGRGMLFSALVLSALLLIWWHKVYARSRSSEKESCGFFANNEHFRECYLTQGVTFGAGKSSESLMHLHLHCTLSWPWNVDGARSPGFQSDNSRSHFRQMSRRWKVSKELECFLKIESFWPWKSRDLVGCISSISTGTLETHNSFSYSAGVKNWPQVYGEQRL